MTKTLSPLRAIRAKCLDCSAAVALEVRHCELDDCPLYPYRLGHNPARAGKGGRGPGRKREIDRKTLTHVPLSREETANGEGGENGIDRGDG
jgi:hypothetical protein